MKSWTPYLPLTIACLLISGVAGYPQSLIYSNAITSLNPAGYWPMHEMEPAAQGDIETNYGTLGVLGNAYYPDYQVNSGAFIRSLPGPLGNGSDQSILFTEPANNGGTVTNAILVPRTSPLTTLKPPFTVEFWYMATNFPLVTWQGDLWSQMGDGGTRTQGMRVYYQNSAPGDLISVLTYGTASGQVNIPAPAVTNNVWHYVVVTCSAATNITAWMDGVSVGSGSVVGKYTPDNRTPFTVANGLGFARSWHGLEAEMAVYTNVITDIATHYSDGTNANSSAGQYFFDVTNDNPVIYLRLNNPGYTIPGGPWPTLLNYGQTNGVAIANGVYTPGTLPGAVVGSAYNSYSLGLISTNVAHLSGVSSFADAGNANAYNPTGSTANFTVSAVFRGNPIDTNRVQSIVGHGTNSWELGLTSLGRLVFNSGTNSTAAVATSSGAGDLVSTVYANDGKWHQVVAVHSFTTNMLYVDGVANGTNILGAANNVGNSYDVIIGSDPCYTNNPVGLGRQFAGQICDVAFFTNALTLAQVQMLYNASGTALNITQQPVSATVNAGSNFTNTVAVSGSSPYAYQWYTNGVAINNATNASLILDPVAGSDASTNYYVVVTNDFSTVTSAVVSLTVYTVPILTSQLPLPYTNLFTVYPGANPTLSLTAIGPPPINYQWFTNGVLDGADATNSLALTNLQGSFANDYCIAGNSFGSVTTMVWSAQVVANPTNSTDGFAPYPQQVLAFNPIGYWRLNDTNLDGPDNNNGDSGYICHDYAGGNDGIYTNVYLGNVNGGTGYNPTTDPSDNSLLVGDDANGGGDPGDQDANSIEGINFGALSGTSAAFSISAWVSGFSTEVPGAGIVTLGWGNGGEQFDLDCGGTGNAYRFFFRDASGTPHIVSSSVLPSTTGGQGPWYHLVGVVDEINNTNVTFYINGAPVGSAIVTNGSGVLASTYAMSIGSRMSSQTTNFNNQFAGYINDVAVFNYALNSNQVKELFSVSGLAPFFTQQPVSTNLDYGTTLTIPAVVSGTPLLSYHWFDNNANGYIVGQTNATMVISNDIASDSYYLTVTNSYGSTNSATVSATVYAGLPNITGGPQNPFYAIAGETATNSVSVYGLLPLAYQWQYSNTLGWVNLSGNRISGAQSSTLTISDTFPSDAGFYQLVITNISGATTSSPAQLVVIGLPLGFNTNGLNGSGLFWTANGGSTFANGLLTLTTTPVSSLDGGGSYFFDVPLYVGGFQASFTYQAQFVDTVPLADGITFCLQDDPRGATNAYGLEGGDLDYLGNNGGNLLAVGNTVTLSVALELNIYPGNGVGGVGYSFDTDGGIGPTAPPGLAMNTNTVFGGVNYGGMGPLDVSIYYANGQMALNFSNEVSGATFSTNLNVGNITQDLGSSTAYVGFTGSYGGAHAIQTITNFAFVSLATQTIQVQNHTNAVISWPASIAGYILQQNSNLNTGNWVNVTNPVNVINGQNEVIVPSNGTNAFYRLMLLQ